MMALSTLVNYLVPQDEMEGCSSVPKKYEGYILKRRKWPMKGWHKRFFVLEKGFMKYAKSPHDIVKGKLHGILDVGRSAMSTQKKNGRIDLDAEDTIFHLKIESQAFFQTWVTEIRAHREYRQGEMKNDNTLVPSSDITEPRMMSPNSDLTADSQFTPGSTPEDSTSNSTRSKDLPDPLENTYSLLESEDLLNVKTKIGSKEEKCNYPGLKFNLSEEAMKEEKEVTLSARVGVDQKEGMPDITPTYECDPPLTFEKPVPMTMRTSISAPAGKEIAVSLLTRDHPGEEWKETQRLSMGLINEVNFEVDRFGGIKVAAECSGVIFHSYNGFHINLETGKTAVTFSKDQAVHDLLEKSLRQRDYVHFDVVNHEILAKFGSKISVSMERKKPEDSTLSKPYPSPSFKLDEKYLLKGKHIVYFDLDPVPEPSDQCRTISMEYECRVNGEPEQCLSLKTKWPRSKGDSDNKFRGSTLNNILADKEARSGGNNYNYNNFSFYTTGNQVAIEGDVNMYDTKNIAGDGSTVVDAPVGQLATGNKNITDQGAGNNFVAAVSNKGGGNVTITNTYNTGGGNVEITKNMNALKIAADGGNFTINEHGTTNTLAVQTPSGNTSAEGAKK